MVERSLEFVRNDEPTGCFGANVQALTGIHQSRVNRALHAVGLYDSGSGVVLSSDIAYDAAMRGANLPVRFEEVLPYFDGFSGDEQAMDDAPEVVDLRLDTVRKVIRHDDHQGMIIAYPCQRNPGQPNFLHFVAAIEPQEEGAELKVMDPSELPGFGGVFNRNEEEVRKMLTPLPDQFIPVCAYVVKLETLPEPPAVGEIIEAPTQPHATHPVKALPPFEGAPMDRPLAPVAA